MMQIGDTYHERYSIKQQLNSAWLADDLAGGGQVLIRRAADFADRQVAEWLGRIWHPGLPRLLETLPGADGEEVLVFEFRTGRTMAELAGELNGRLPLAEALPAFRQIARVLAFLHHQSECAIFHLDIKPDHLILNDQGDACLIDFGAALSNQSGLLAGNKPLHALTPTYAAPEQLAGCPGAASDIYSFGLTMLQLLTGSDPSSCRSLPLADIAGELPDRLQQLIGRCLQSDPTRRYADADELAYDLETALNDINRPDCHEAELAQPAAPAECQSQDADTSPDTVLAFSRGSQTPVICVWGGAEFGCELAAIIAETRRVLVVDADLLNPRADLLLGMLPDHEAGGELTAAGLDLALQEEQRGTLDLSALNRMIQPTRVAGVRALVTHAGLDHYEYFTVESLSQVIGLASMVSDVLIVLCSRFVFDAFTCLCLQAATRIVVPLKGDCASFRERHRAIDYLSSRQLLDVGRLSFAAFPYNSGTDLSPGTLSELSAGRLAGCISGNGRRRSDSIGAKPYATAIDRTNRREYRSIIRRLRLPAFAIEGENTCHW